MKGLFGIRKRRVLFSRICLSAAREFNSLVGIFLFRNVASNVTGMNDSPKLAIPCQLFEDIEIN